MSKHQDTAPPDPNRTPTGDTGRGASNESKQNPTTETAPETAPRTTADTTDHAVDDTGGEPADVRPPESAIVDVARTTDIDVDVARAFVIGGCPIGRTVATTLAETGVPVELIEETTASDPPADVQTTAVETLSASILDDAVVDEDTVVLALHPRDETNLLFAQLARTRFDADRILARVNDPTRLVAYDELDVETVDVTTAISRDIANTL